MADIQKEILRLLNTDKVSDIAYEGANIVLYTKNKDYFLNHNGDIKQVVNEIKKRVELRAHPEIVMDAKDAESLIKSIIPEDAGLAQVIFDKERSRVIIEAEKPGIAIGKQGMILREIKEKTLWVPHVRRTPPIRSPLIENIRAILYMKSDYRRKFLDKTGHRIYDGWIRGKKHEWIRLTYLGSGRQVGRSCILLQTPESNVLLDCGINPAISSNTEEAFPYLDAPEFDINKLDAVIASHAHLDHTGFVPYLFKYGYRGPVYCTAPTRDVMALTLLDYVKIQRMNGLDPVYEPEMIKETILHTICLNYEEVTDVTPDVRITLYNAGHILGSAMVHIHVGNGLHNLLYSADSKFGPTYLLDPAVIKFPRLETLMLESTYGGKENIQPSKKICEMQLADKIKETIARRGRVLIPVLGVGRAQEVMMILTEMAANGEFDTSIPVYVDGIVWDITAIHSAYPEFLNSRIRKLIFHKNENPFLSEMFKRVGSSKERQHITEEGGPCVVLATSGMLSGGPSVEYLKSFASSERNTLIFVSYQGEGSLGRRIQRGEKEFTFSSGKKQEMVQVNLEIMTIEGLSGHSDRKQLMSFVYKCTPSPKKIIINHGETSRGLDLASSIYKQFRTETVCPRNLESVRLK